MFQFLSKKAYRLGQVAILAALLVSCSESPKLLDYQGKTMGTSWSVKLVQPTKSQESISQQQIQARLDEVNQVMSNWVETSDVSKLNRLPAGCLLVSEHTEKVARAAKKISLLSEGFFDPTASPLIELWGFGVHGEAPKEPDPIELDAAMRRLDPLALSTTERQICKNRADIQVNYSAIAKGYGVDQVVDLLRDAGYRDFLVEVGGELYAQGHKLNQQSWKVGIERPTYGLNQQLYSTLELDGMAVATSGDYRNYYQVGSVRYSHIINPKTGRPVRHQGASVTVLAQSAMLADAWATGILAAGPEKGLKLAERQGLAVMMILHSEDGDEHYSERVSPAWEEAVNGAGIPPHSS